MKTMYALVAVLILLLAISGTIGLYYYVEYNQQSSVSSSFAEELNSANLKYNETVSKYNSLVGTYGNSLGSFKQLASLYNGTVSVFNSLSANFSSFTGLFNRTMALLVATLSVLNTSEPAYRNASESLNALWSEYNSLKASYENSVNQFESFFRTFQIQVKAYEQANNVSISGNLSIPVTPITSQLLSANFLVDFGNSTFRWINNTAIQAGWNAYIFTLVETHGNLNATWYPQYGEHFITGIDGVSQTSAESWFLWMNQNGTSWQLEQSGADLVNVLNGSTIAWTLCSENTNYLPTCSPP